MTEKILPNQIFVLKDGGYHQCLTNSKHYKPNTPMFACGVCGTVLVGKDEAELCCKQKYCECGTLIEHRGYNSCEPCRLKSLLENAEVIEYEGGWVNVFNSETYFESMEALLEHYEGKPAEKWPEWVHPCEEDGWGGLDIDSVIESEMDDLSCEDVRDQLVDEDELVEFVRKWNEKQHVRIYRPIQNKKIKVQRSK